MSTIPMILSTSSSQQVDLSDDGGSGNPQSPVGSPPLILAFLAIGVFSVAMIAVFGWRRIQLQLGRETSLWGHPQQRRSTRGIDSAGLADLKFREKPVLWEVQVEHDKEGEEHGSWDNILVCIQALPNFPTIICLASSCFACTTWRPFKPHLDLRKLSPTKTQQIQWIARTTIYFPAATSSRLSKLAGLERGRPHVDISSSSS